MIDAAPESLAAMAANALSAEPPPTEAQIDDFLSRIAVAFQVSTGTIAEARKLIHARFAIRMELGETLTSVDEHAPWLDACRAAIDPFYWTRYREFLVGNGWPPLVAATLEVVPFCGTVCGFAKLGPGSCQAANLSVSVGPGPVAA